MLEVELPLRYCFLSNDMTRVMLLDGFRRSYFHWQFVKSIILQIATHMLTIIGLQSVHMVRSHLAGFSAFVR